MQSYQEFVMVLFATTILLHSICGLRDVFIVSNFFSGYLPFIHVMDM